MPRIFTSHVSKIIHVPLAQVWEALTNPEIIKQYFFGTTVVTDWKKGSQIIWKGQWQGKQYEDHGTILEIIPEKKFTTTYWSSMTGTPDQPEYYKTITYTLTPQDDGTNVTLVQDNNANEDEQKHSEYNWGMVLESLKKLLEENSNTKP